MAEPWVTTPLAGMGAMIFKSLQVMFAAEVFSVLLVAGMSRTTMS